MKENSISLASVDGPYVIMVVGVNGVGKTTTIGKLASKFKKEGKKVVLGAADTFRAAAIDQLVIWADRVGVDIPSGMDSNTGQILGYAPYCDLVITFSSLK